MLEGLVLKTDLSWGGDSANISESEREVDENDLPLPLPNLNGGWWVGVECLEPPLRILDRRDGRRKLGLLFLQT
jgi:hypothetical protein